MIGWKRRLRIPASLRRWSATVRALFHGWSWPYWKSLFGRIFLPRPKPDRGVKLELEALAKRESPTYLLSDAATVFGAAAVVHTAQSSSQTPDVEQHAAVADTAMNLPTAEDEERADLIFCESTAPDGSFSVDDDRSLAAADQWVPSGDDAEPKHTANDPALNAVMAADQALVDPVSHPAPNAADGPHHAGPPMGNDANGTPPNFAGAYTGAGQGPGGASTPFAGGGGNSSGGGGGGSVGGNLATLANEGAFSNPALTAAAAQGASGPAAMTTPVATPNAAMTTPVATPTVAPVTHLTKALPNGTSASDNSPPSADDPTGNNLLTNGGFETDDLTGWTLTGNTGYTGVEEGIGNNSTFAAYLGPIGSDGYLSQTIATTPGTVYQVSFDLESDGMTPNDFTATFAGQTLQSGTNLETLASRVARMSQNGPFPSALLGD